MFYQNELSFLRDVFEKSHVGVDLINAEDIKRARADKKRHGLFNNREYLSKLFLSLAHNTVYKITDFLECTYRFLLLPDLKEQTVLCIGPYLSEEVSEKRQMEIAEGNGISPHKQKYLSEYYSGLAVLTEDSPLVVMFNSFCNRIWRGHPFAIKDIIQGPKEAPFTETMGAAELTDTLINMKAIELRYSFENEMMRAVELGQMHMEERFKTAFSNNAFEKRLQDPLRNVKNYSIIMNTLLRKAAERGGVHPVYLDRVSSEFAKKIEALQLVSDDYSLMHDMFRTYCRLVQSHSVKGFSEPVRKAVLIIDSDLSADLSTATVAASLGISLGYLSAIFRKETGNTLSEYVRHRRMEYAAYLLGATKLQIQTVALHCGIMDVQYFSKLFKKEYGKTPSDYRCSLGAENIK